MFIIQCFSANLRKIVVMHRHGARTTIVPAPNDLDTYSCDLQTLISQNMSPNQLALTYDIINPQLGNCSTGDLLGPGYTQLKNVGYYLLKQHKEFIKKTSKRYFRSTFNQRTLASIKALLDYIFPDENHDVHVGDENLDPMEINTCPFYDRYLKETQKYPSMAQWDQQLKEMKLILKYPDNEELAWWHIADQFEAREFMRMPVVKNVNQTMLGLINKMHVQQWKELYCNNNKELLERFLKATSGLFIPELIQQLQNENEFVVFSAHQETIAPLLKILTSDYQCEEPPLGSLMEFLVDGDNLTLKFQGQVQKMFCGQECSLQTVINELKKWIVNDVERAEMCK